jgi:hypothetical protein
LSNGDHRWFKRRSPKKQMSVTRANENNNVNNNLSRPRHDDMNLSRALPPCLLLGFIVTMETWSPFQVWYWRHSQSFIVTMETWWLFKVWCWLYSQTNIYSNHGNPISMETLEKSVVTSITQWRTYVLDIQGEEPTMVSLNRKKKLWKNHIYLIYCHLSQEFKTCCKYKIINIIFFCLKYLCGCPLCCLLDSAAQGSCTARPLATSLHSQAIFYRRYISRVSMATPSTQSIQLFVQTKNITQGVLRLTGRTLEERMIGNLEQRCLIDQCFSNTFPRRNP